MFQGVGRQRLLENRGALFTGTAKDTRSDTEKTGSSESSANVSYHRYSRETKTLCLMLSQQEALDAHIAQWHCRRTLNLLL